LREAGTGEGTTEVVGIPDLHQIDRPEAGTEERQREIAMADEKQALSPELVAMFGEMMRENNRTMMDAVAKLREPSDEEKEKKAKEQQLKLQTAEEMRAAALAIEEDKAMRRANCPHAIVHPTNGTRMSAWRGQVNADNCYRPTCTICLTEMPRIPASTDEIRGGVNLNLYVSATIPYFERKHKQAFGRDCGDHNCYLCHPKDEELAAAIARPAPRSSQSAPPRR
jgi:hypothetical protein